MECTALAFHYHFVTRAGLPFMTVFKNTIIIPEMMIGYYNHRLTNEFMGSLGIRT